MAKLDFNAMLKRVDMVEHVKDKQAASAISNKAVGKHQGRAWKVMTKIANGCEKLYARLADFFKGKGNRKAIFKEHANMVASLKTEMEMLNREIGAVKNPEAKKKLIQDKKELLADMNKGFSILNRLEYRAEKEYSDEDKTTIQTALSNLRKDIQNFSKESTDLKRRREFNAKGGFKPGLDSIQEASALEELFGNPVDEDYF